MSRSVTCLLLAAFILFIPAARQVFEVKNPLLPRWEMFSGKGLGIYAVHFDLVEPSGERRTVHWGEFSTPPPAGTRLRAARADSLRAIVSEGTRICRHVGAGASLFATARLAIAKKSGWRKVGGEKLDLCRRDQRSEYAARGSLPKKEKRASPARGLQ